VSVESPRRRPKLENRYLQDYDALSAWAVEVWTFTFLVGRRGAHSAVFEVWDPYWAGPRKPSALLLRSPPGIFSGSPLAGDALARETRAASNAPLDAAASWCLRRGGAPASPAARERPLWRDRRLPPRSAASAFPRVRSRSR
jgi:hypothetical protein